VSLSIMPALTEKGAIAFSGKATDRFKHGQRVGETLSVLACVTRETYFKGTTASGTTVVLNAGPSTSTSAKKDGATVVKTASWSFTSRSRKSRPSLKRKKPAPSKSGKPSTKKKS